jgi:phage shock protein A
MNDHETFSDRNDREFSDRREAMEERYDAHSTARGAVYLLIGILAVLTIACGFLFWRVHQMETATSAWNATTSQEIAALRQTVAANDSTHFKNMESLQADLEAARQQAAMTAGRAKQEALKHADQLARKLADEQQQVATKLTEVQQDATTANTKLADVTNDVATTKTDVAATKTELQNTVADLKRVRGDMGVLSDRIATNGTELAALRTLGERNYVEFNIAKTKAPQKVGDVQLLLKKTDVKRNRFSIAVLADDRTVEKRDRTINEPVQFYVAKAHQPYEIVVNEVTKDHIAGYLATPKVEMARR